MGTTLVLVDSGAYKDMIAGRMQRDNGRGSWMVYSGCDMEYANRLQPSIRLMSNMATLLRKSGS